MNPKKIVANIGVFISQFFGSFISIIKIIIRSKFNLQLPIAKSNSCTILGNGPSLKQSLDKNIDFFKKETLICVNGFSTTKEFAELRPSYYVMLDPGYFIYKDRKDIVETFAALNNKVNWDLHLFVPYLYKNDGDIKNFIKQHSYIKVVFFNYVVFEGFKFLGFNIFRKNLAMPQFSNVLGPSILLAINMGFKEINIAGADHSWFANIEINELNQVCQRDVHFYDTTQQPLIPIIDPLTNKTQTMKGIFEVLYKVFNSYQLLNEYAVSAGCSIFNISAFSYIDVFKRKKIEGNH